MSELKTLLEEKKHLESQVNKIRKVFNDLIIEVRIYRRRIKRIDQFLEAAQNGKN